MTKGTRTNPFSTQEPRIEPPKKVGIPHLSHTKLLTSMQTKAVIEPLHAQILNDIAFVVVSPFSPFGCKMARVAVLASCGFAMFSNTPPF